jgi:hypothetical protein
VAVAHVFAPKTPWEANVKNLGRQGDVYIAEAANYVCIKSRNEVISD